MTSHALVERWRTPTGTSLAEDVFAHLLTGRPVDGLDVQEHEGRVDLRGLPAPPPRRLQRFEAAGFFVEQLGDLLEFRRVALQGLDLRGAQLQSLRFFDSTISDCRFDNARCSDWRLWHCDVADTSFAGADLREGALGTWHEGQRDTWRRIDFSKADLRGTSPSQGLFEDCDFSAANLTGVQFKQCALIRCRFAGELRDVLFDGRDLSRSPGPPPMRGVDFSGASLRDVEFRGFDLEDVELPVSPGVFLVRRFRCVAEQGLTELQSDNSVTARKLKAILQNGIRGPGKPTDADVFNRADYVASGGEGLAELAEGLFRKLERGCLDEERPRAPRSGLLGDKRL